MALAGAAGGGITAIAKAGGAANRERQKQLKEAQNHEVYFYYEAGKMSLRRAVANTSCPRRRHDLMAFRKK